MGSDIRAHTVCFAPRPCQPMASFRRVDYTATETGIRGLRRRISLSGRRIAFRVAGAAVQSEQFGRRSGRLPPTACRRHPATPSFHGFARSGRLAPRWGCDADAVP